MPRTRTPSRGRPPKKAGVPSRSQSASRQRPRAKSPAKKPGPKKQAATPKLKPKTTPVPSRSRSASRSRKVHTAPAAVSAKQGRVSRLSPRVTSTTKTVTSASYTRGAPSYGAISVSTSSAGRDSLSPPQLRSRTFATHIQQQQSQRSPVPKKVQRGAVGIGGWRVVQAIKGAPKAVGQQLGKIGRAVKRGPRPAIRKTAAHLRANWKYWLLLVAALLLAVLLYKFQREVMTNVRETNKQIGDFLGRQYEQHHGIFGREQWQQLQDLVEQYWKKIIASLPAAPAPPPTPPPASTPPPHPH